MRSVTRLCWAGSSQPAAIRVGADIPGPVEESMPGASSATRLVSLYVNGQPIAPMTQ